MVLLGVFLSVWIYSLCMVKRSGLVWKMPAGEPSVYSGHTGRQLWLCTAESPQIPFPGCEPASCRTKLKRGSHGSPGKLSSRWSMQLQRQYHHSINSACCVPVSQMSFCGICFVSLFGHGNFLMDICLRVNFGKFPTNPYTFFIVHKIPNKQNTLKKPK